MAEAKFLAFDLGAESGRAILGTLIGDRLTLEEKHRFANPGGSLRTRLQWNLLSQWEEIKTGLKKTAPDLHGKPLAGIGVDTWGVDFGLVAPSGEVLANPMMYRDPQTEGILDRVFAVVPREKIYQATGIQFMRINSLYQLLAMKERKSSLLDAAQSLLFMPDLFNYLFTGERKIERSIASTSQMYDPRKKTWATGLLESLGLPTRLLGEIISSGTIVGTLRDHVATHCNIAPAPIIAPGCHDTASAVAAVPAVPSDSTDDWCYISSGTWSLVGVELDQPIITPQAESLGYTNELGVCDKIRFLKNIMGMWMIQECRRHWQKQGHDHGYAELTAMASRAESFGPLINLDYAPFVLPGQIPDKIDDFCVATKQRKPGSRGEYIRTCLESLALSYRRTIEGLEEVLGRKIRTIHIVGGGSQNELLNQMTADATGRAVVAGPVEATAIGNILAQAMATGHIKSLTEGRAIVREHFNVKHFEPQRTKYWESAYDRFRAIVARK